MIIHNDCLDEMRKMSENSISAIVTDPPYGLSFMGKDWDEKTIVQGIWAEMLRIAKPGSFLLSFGGTRTYHRTACAIQDAGWQIRDCLCWLYGSGFPKSHNHFGIEGYGTALKPAWEPIIMAMKSLDGTFKQNAEKWGQAGVNIDGCRIGADDTRKMGSHKLTSKGIQGGGFGSGKMEYDSTFCSGSSNGRWPANLVLDDGSAEQLDEQSGIGASRFFYCAKASSSERGEGNGHPTVKPLKLMGYLIKLVMPPKDGILLDPFAGSGTTIVAAINLGFHAIGIEKQKEYCDIAISRIENLHLNKKDEEMYLF